MDLNGCDIEEFKIVKKEFIFFNNKVNFNIIRIDKVVWFLAKDVAIFLEYIDKDQAIRKNVSEKYKNSYDKLIMSHTRLEDGYDSSIYPTTIFINKSYTIDH